MSLFTIYEKAAASNMPQTLANQDVEIVRDRFSIIACLFTPIWCIWHRLWLELVAYMGVAFVLGFVAFFVGESAAGWVGFLVAVLIGLEASAIRGYALTRKGYIFQGEVVSSSRRDAEWCYTAGQMNNQATPDDDVQTSPFPSDSDLNISTTLSTNERPSGAGQ